MDILGFDYDYTLASYTDRVQHFIYSNALRWLIEVQKYPKNLEVLQFDPTFAIRGLHFDTKRGNLLKIDQLGHLQVDAAYFGRHKIPLEKLKVQYSGLTVQMKYIENLRSLSDLYCLPEACLVSDIIQHFIDNDIDFDPSYVFDDVMKAKDYVHDGVLHQDIMNNLTAYLRVQPELSEFFQRLRSSGKKLFLLTNSSFPFVDKGMSYILGGRDDWIELFDVVMTSARKPSFFIKTQPFRVFAPSSGQVKWEKITEFRKGEVYVQGSLEEFLRLTKWKGANVLYFGDHLFNDLREPNRIEGWKTGVIIPELEREVQIQNSYSYRSMLAEMLEVERAFGRCHFYGRKEEPVTVLLEEYRDKLQKALKETFNPTFGSVFRTHKHATLFANSIQRYADLYTSHIENFLDRPLHYVFYPDRIFFPHEAKIPSMKHLPFHLRETDRIGSNQNDLSKEMKR
jgi:HAD superfamily 5'-nucleotidase-like hydrolase